MPATRPTPGFVDRFIDNAYAFLAAEAERATALRAETASDRATATPAGLEPRTSMLAVAQADKHQGYALGKSLEKLRGWREQLTDEQQTRLEALPGFAWDPIDARWHRNLQAVRGYAEEGAEPIDMPPALYVWWLRQLNATPTPPARSQRRFPTPQARAAHEATRTSAYHRDVAHKKLALQVGFPVAERPFNSFLAAAKGWLQANPGATLADLPTNAEITLGQRTHRLHKQCTYYRRRMAGAEGTHPLPPADIAALEALPAWTWELNDAYRRNMTTAAAKSTT